MGVLGIWFLIAGQLAGELPPEERFVDRVLRYAEVSSTEQEPDGIHQLARLLAGELRALGFQTHWDYNARSLTARFQVAEPKLRVLLLAHLDTRLSIEEFGMQPSVLENSDQRSIEAGPYNPVLSGSGVADDKSGLAFSLELVDYFLNSPWRDQIEWRLFFGADEEIGFKRSASALNRIQHQSDLALSFEPGAYDRISEQPLFPESVYGIRHLHWRIRGRPAHSAINPQEGVSALPPLTRSMELLDVVGQERDSMIFNITDLSSSRSINVIPYEASFRVGIRYADTTALTSLDLQIAKIASSIKSEFGVQVEYDIIEKGFPQALLNRSQRQILREISAQLGLPPPLFMSTAGRSYAGNVRPPIPVYEAMGPYGFSFHSRNEVLWAGSFSERLRLNCRLVLHELSQK